MVWNGTGSQDIGTILAGTNELTGGLLGLFVLLLIWAITYFRLGSQPTREAVVGASFVTAIAAFLLRFLGVVSDVYFGVSVVLAIGSLVLLINRN